MREYWIVDSKKQRVIVYSFDYDMMEEYSFEDEIPVGIYDGLSMKLE